MAQVDKLFFFSQAFWLFFLSLVFFTLFLRFLILPLNFLEKTRNLYKQNIKNLTNKIQAEKNVVYNLKEDFLTIRFDKMLSVLAQDLNQKLELQFNLKKFILEDMAFKQKLLKKVIRIKRQKSFFSF